MSLWLPVIGTVVGGLLGITGSLVGATAQSRWAAKARNEQYLREDQFRLYSKRVEIYTAFNIAAGKTRAVLIAGGARDDQERRAVRNVLFEAQIPMELMARCRTRATARALLDFTDSVVFAGKQFDPEEWGPMIRELRHACRHDLIGDAEGHRGPDCVCRPGPRS
jgi:uncharacterized membrane protein